MSRHWKFKKYHSGSKKMTEFEKFQWIAFFIICAVLFGFYLIKGFISNCVFEWPIRWDVHACWNEQINPAKEKAAEKAINFIP
ncbi:hypothetical protein C4544_03490 [candidate division WS5 bacterium]|uniref:Uncharacterized protein n=1 Tax=candidate division WS5 bacterium TaxID=2093353 RepID=A0A419DDQ8_9BACT|nr:MAG: hypothetical protein C4544_03490 [candidate division WS5 bacterium]